MVTHQNTKRKILRNVKPKHCQHTHMHILLMFRCSSCCIPYARFFWSGFFYSRVARVLHSFWWRDVHIRWYWFVHERTEAHTQVTGGFAHFFSQSISQLPQLSQIIIHGVGQVHQVVEIHRVICDLPHLQRERPWVICGKEEREKWLHTYINIYGKVQIFVRATFDKNGSMF